MSTEQEVNKLWKEFQNTTVDSAPDKQLVSSMTKLAALIDKLKETKSTRADTSLEQIDKEIKSAKTTLETCLKRYTVLQQTRKHVESNVTPSETEVLSDWKKIGAIVRARKEQKDIILQEGELQAVMTLLESIKTELQKLTENSRKIENELYWETDMEKVASELTKYLQALAKTLTIPRTHSMWRVIVSLLNRGQVKPPQPRNQ